MSTKPRERTPATPGRFPLGALRRAAALVIACVVLAAGTASAAGTTSLRVFAAASLSDAFADIAHAFEAAHPGVTVQTNLAGSQQLAAQLALGADADVFASADERWMDDVAGKQLLAGDPVVFARNRLVVIVPRVNPARIARLQDLGKRGSRSCSPRTRCRRAATAARRCSGWRAATVTRRTTRRACSRTSCPRRRT
jgi:molybdate transport system substrate-binding protein